jgi:hypothetical protein
MIFLSFGAGVQSSVLLMLAIRGEIERPDHVIFADTGFEPQAVYEQVKWARKQCDKASLPFHVATPTLTMREEFEAFESGDKKHWDARPPLFVEDLRRGGRSSMQRQCTRRAKIDPIQRLQLQLMGHKTARTAVDSEAILQIGISTDEARRAAPSHDRWIDRSYPLIDPLKMSRADCQAWWEANYPHRSLGTSACLGCPNRSDREWAAMKRDRPQEWAQVVEFDAAIRSATGMRGESYLHRSLRPISEVPLGEGQDTLDLEDAVYCAGGCGL